MAKIKYLGFMILALAIFGVVFITGCTNQATEPQESEEKADLTKIAIWLAKKEEIISSNKPYFL